MLKNNCDSFAGDADARVWSNRGGSAGHDSVSGSQWWVVSSAYTTSDTWKPGGHQSLIGELIFWAQNRQWVMNSESTERTGQRSATGRWETFEYHRIGSNNEILAVTSSASETSYLLESIAGTSFDAAESGPPPLHSVRCPDHCCQESFPQDLKVRRLKMH